MEEATAAALLAALGHEARLRIFRHLVRAGPQGLNIGEIGRQIGLPASTLAHHLGALVQVSLVLQVRQGREVFNHANFELMRALLGFVASECCAGVEIAERGRD